MFKDENLESINIKSDTLSEKYVRDQSCQTKPIELKNQYSQAILRLSVDVQTELSHTPASVTRLRVDNSKKLETFMLTVYPLVSEQLTANVRSHAFDDYELDELNISENIECKVTLTCPEQKEEDKLDITCLSWNSIGSIVASALGKLEHDTWCTHPSQIHIWNVNKQENSTPNKTIDADNCVTAIAFHPSDPPILVSGDFSGKIHVWDLSKEDNILVAFSGKENETHHEAVNQIVWIPSTGSVLNFISTGSDGNIFLWMYNKLKQHLGLISTFQLSSDVIPRNVRKSSMRSGTALGITCASLTYNQNKDILVGTENGGVFCCKEKTNGGGYTIIAFGSHEATVNSIDSSQAMKTFFVTCSLDMCIHVYQESQSTPLHKVDPMSGYLFAIQWSPTKHVFYVSTAASNILVYQIEDDEVHLKNTIDVGNKKVCINSLAVNKEDKIASADSNATIKIWEFKND